MTWGVGGEGGWDAGGGFEGHLKGMRSWIALCLLTPVQVLCEGSILWGMFSVTTGTVGCVLIRCGLDGVRVVWRIESR